MRARTRWKTSVPDQHLFVILEILGWLPKDQTAPTVLEHKERIIASLPKEVQQDARDNHVYTTYRARTDSWGIITRDQSGLLTIRQDQNDPELVCKTAEDLLESLLMEYPDRWPSKEYGFEMVGTIDLLERHGEKQIQEGHFVAGRIHRTLMQRPYESLAVLVLGGLSFICFWLSAPHGVPDLTTPQGVRMHWQLDLLGRLGTAFAATAATALLYIVFTLIDVKRHRHVVWYPVGQKGSDRMGARSLM